MATAGDFYNGWIERHREGPEPMEWDDILLLGQSCEEDAEEYLEELEDEGWPETSLETWRKHVLAYKSNPPRPITHLPSTLSAGEGSTFSPRTGSTTATSRLLSSLRASMSEISVQRIKSSAATVISHLRSDTRRTGARKGLVYGSVQSGKTANMEALVSMAADGDEFNEWNVFVILSGTIENLRLQTQARFERDLKNGIGVTWHVVDLNDRKRKWSAEELKLSPSEVPGHYKGRYVIVCLKQKNRLEKLIKWLYSVPARTERMRLIIIDDEADQASVNTAAINDPDEMAHEQERKAINRLIVNLVNGKLADGGEPPVPMQAINYISYTATPYANVLNEISEESLYPKDFIHSLQDPYEYFGSNVIFGNEERFDDSGSPNCVALGVDRPISLDDVNAWSKIHAGGEASIPDSMKRSVLWFFSAAAALRNKGYHKPISMLIHTSSRTKDHETDYRTIWEWISGEDESDFLAFAKEVYERETAEFTKKEFESRFSRYGLLDKVDDSFPSFDDIKNDILLFKRKKSFIRLGDEGSFEYSDGVHVCVDNCVSRKFAPEDTTLRVVYPSSDQLDEMFKAPVFMVFGGNTLSRGLTIEGLVCTYFLRTVSQADTLMQMARWFGYRPGYELYQRIWLSHDAKTKYRELAKAEYALKKEIEKSEGIATPLELAPMIRTMPDIAKFMLTAKSKMQLAEAVTYDFTGFSMEITQFDEDAQTIGTNIRVLENFVSSLTGDVAPVRKNNAIVWEGIAPSKIAQFIDDMKISELSDRIDAARSISRWAVGEAKEKYEYWSVAVCGAQGAPSGSWEVADLDLCRVERSRKSNVVDVIDIGSLRDGKDAICDISLDDVAGTPLELEYKKALSGRKNLVEARARLGRENTPLLLLYRIDKASVPGRSNTDRLPLGTADDLVGFSVVVPGASKRSTVSSVRIRQPKRKD